MYTAVNYSTRAGSKKVEVEVWVLGPAHDTTLLRQGKHQHHQAKALTASALHCHRGRLFGIICWPLTCHISRAAKEPCCFASRVSVSTAALRAALGEGTPRALEFQDHDHGPRSWASTDGTVAQCRSNWITARATGRGRKRQSNGSSSWGIRREGGQLRCFPSQGLYQQYQPRARGQAALPGDGGEGAVCSHLAVGIELSLHLCISSAQARCQIAARRPLHPVRGHVGSHVRAQARRRLRKGKQLVGRQLTSPRRGEGIGRAGRSHRGCRARRTREIEI
jgi:hypothetical protein